MRKAEHYALTRNGMVVAIFEKAKAMTFDGMKDKFLPHKFHMSFVPAEPDLYEEWMKWVNGERREPVRCALCRFDGNHIAYRLGCLESKGGRKVGME